MEISVLRQGLILELCIYFLLPTWPLLLSATFGTAPVNQMKEKSYNSALSSGKCPACRKGNIFKYPFSRISRFSDMNSHCSNCGASFEPEPGFYFGAMFITYAFNVVLLVAFGLSLYYFVELPEAIYLILIAALALIATPASFRSSRILWLYWFGGLHYRPDSES